MEYIIQHCELCNDTVILESPIPYGVMCSRCEEIGNTSGDKCADVSDCYVPPYDTRVWEWDLDAL